MFETICGLDTPESQKALEAAHNYLSAYPKEKFHSENHKFFILKSKKIMIKQYEHDEIQRAINSAFIGYMINEPLVLKSHGVLLNSRGLYLVSELLNTTPKTQDVEITLSLNLQKLALFHKLMTAKYIDSDINTAGFVNLSGVEPCFMVGGYET